MLQIFLVFLRVSPEHATFWVQPVSFVFVGILAVSSVRGFLGSISNLIHYSSGGVRSTAGGARGAHGDGEVSTLIALLLGFVMGTYFVSTLLLIRMSVPEKFRGGITRAVGDIRFFFFHRWFDVIFVLSACASIVAHMLLSAMRTSRISGNWGLSQMRGGRVVAQGAELRQPLSAELRGDQAEQHLQQRQLLLRRGLEGQHHERASSQGSLQPAFQAKPPRLALASTAGVGPRAYLRPVLRSFPSADTAS